MSPPYARDHWNMDERQIVAARLKGYPVNDGILLDEDGWRFERFHRDGEMAAIPYLRCRKVGSTICYEAPLRHFSWINFKDEVMES